MFSDEKFKSNHNQTWVVVAPRDPSFIGGVQGHMYIVHAQGHPGSSKGQFGKV